MLLVRPESVPPNYHDSRWNWFQNCLGVLDETYVPVYLPAIDKPRYRSRKGEIAINVLRLGGLATDSKILRIAIFKTRWFESPPWYVPNPKFTFLSLHSFMNPSFKPFVVNVVTFLWYKTLLLVDVRYQNAEGFLAPYRGQRYHINIWKQGHMPTSKEEYFNMKPFAAKNVIEKSFGVLKMRFATLRSPSYYPITTQTCIVTACYLLHDLIKREMPNNPIENEYTGWKRDHIHNVEVDNHITTIESFNQWTEERDALATAMYNHWLENGGGQEVFP
ncbi:uncharacterized protein LOC131303047 [Rhododendron vialii]|uniref:uncharacterized protein LOC131303047 n=1 Tax=Rhododendron vialii TaxID=182163 RepID=UPI00265F833D|nr:uncharacterized protein LOC131303047 [Rhododendron vialii]